MFTKISAPNKSLHEIESLLKEVVIFLPSIETGGVERNAVMLANDLAEKGVNVRLAHARIDPVMRDRLMPEVRLEPIGPDMSLPFIHPRIVDAAATAAGLLRVLRRLPPRRSVAIAFQSASAAVPICRMAGVPLVARIANHPDLVAHEASLQRRLAEAVKPIAYRFARMVITNSMDLTEYFQRKLPGIQVETVYNPVDPEAVRRRAQEPCEHPWLAQRSTPVFVGVGRLSRQKSFDVLIRAFAQLRASHEARLLILGEGTERPSLENLIRELGMAESVALVGFEPNVHRYVARADAFVLSSRYEGLPNALLESIAVGTPAISTDCLTGPREILLNGAGGLLVPVGHVEALGKAMERYLTDPGFARERLKAAVSGLSRFEHARTMARYRALLTEALKP